MTNINRTRKQTLEKITHETIGTLLLSFNFIPPILYANKFYEIAKKYDIEVTDIDIKKDIFLIASAVEQKEQQNIDSLQKISNITISARDAINKKNIKTLEEVSKSTNELIKRIKELEREANQDFLTGLKNRRGLIKAIEKNRDKHFREGVYFAFDLDNFKLINDTYGHAIGDQVLKIFANKVLVRNCGKIPSESKVLSRNGGDEFTAIISKEYFNEALLRFQNHQNKPTKLQVKHNNKKEIIELNFSLGYTIFTKDTAFEDIAFQSDKEMYLDKRKRKTFLNQVS